MWTASAEYIHRCTPANTKTSARQWAAQAVSALVHQRAIDFLKQIFLILWIDPHASQLQLQKDMAFLPCPSAELNSVHVSREQDFPSFILDAYFYCKSSKPVVRLMASWRPHNDCFPQYRMHTFVVYICSIPKFGDQVKFMGFNVDTGWHSGDHHHLILGWLHIQFRQ